MNALSRLSHRFIVRYFTTWVETAEPASAAVSDESGTESGTEDGTSVPDFSERRISSSDHITFDLADLDDVGSGSRSSFPSIHFSRSSSPRTDEGEGDEGDSYSPCEEFSSSQEASPTPPPILSRTLYIQMVGFDHLCAGVIADQEIGICRTSDPERGWCCLIR